MDLSDSFQSVARFLLKRGTDPRVSLLPANTDAHGKYLATVSCLTQTCRVNGTGVGQNQPEAFLKAMAELGEGILKIELGLKCRSGLAGGLIQSNVVVRAQSELTERDSFFYHYRNLAPLKRIGSRELSSKRCIEIYQLQSAIDGYHVALVTDRQTMTQARPFLSFATGAHTHWEAAVSKAIDEFISTTAFLELNLNAPASREGKGSTNSSAMDLHLMAAIDPRNLEIFEKLLGTAMSPESKRPTFSVDQSPWKIVNLESPVRFLKFAQVSNPKLQGIQFGVPEAGTENNAKPLYHPFW